jgi:hypothetical protein
MSVSRLDQHSLEIYFEYSDPDQASKLVPIFLDTVLSVKDFAVTNNLVFSLIHIAYANFLVYYFTLTIDRV